VDDCTFGVDGANEEVCSHWFLGPDLFKDGVPLCPVWDQLVGWYQGCLCLCGGCLGWLLLGGYGSLWLWGVRHSCRILSMSLSRTKVKEWCDVAMLR
jgi:hypothetical protein